MRVPRLFLNAPLLANEKVELPRDTAHYLTRVLRRSVDDDVVLFNGDGNNYFATVVAAGKKAELAIQQALAKNTKLDLIVQKATELGVARIIPVTNERSVKRIDAERRQRKLDHWRSIARSACEQCDRSVVPTIDNPLEFDEWLEQTDAATTLLLHPTSHQRINDLQLTPRECSVVIGPEGGFSANETQAAAQKGLLSVSCGPRILRTETAGPAVIAILQSHFGDLG